MLSLLRHLTAEQINQIRQLSQAASIEGSAFLVHAGVNEPTTETIAPEQGIAVAQEVFPKAAAEAKLQALLNGLSDEQLIELTALTWLGRVEPEDCGKPVRQAFRELYDCAQERHDYLGEIGYLLAKPLNLYLGFAASMDPDGTVPATGPIGLNTD